MSVTVSRTRPARSSIAVVVISPATMTRPVVTIVSHATRPRGSFRMISSSTASEIWSATLSGCPPVTDSEVKKNSFMPDGSRPENSIERADYTSEPLFWKEILELLAQDLPDLGRGPVEQQFPREFPRLVGHRLAQDPLHQRD